MYTLFGVWKSQYDPYLGGCFYGKKKDYALELHYGHLMDPTGNTTYCRENYCPALTAGKETKSDIIKMTLNLVEGTLSFTVNGTDHGKAFDVEKVSYRAAVTLCGKDSKFTLLSYECSV